MYGGGWLPQKDLVGSALSSNFFSDYEWAVLLLMEVQLTLGARWVSKRDIANALSKYGFDFEEAVKSLERIGYTVSVGHKGFRLMLTAKGENVEFNDLALGKSGINHSGGVR
jgi:biotin operon repressor